MFGTKQTLGILITMTVNYKVYHQTIGISSDWHRKQSEIIGTPDSRRITPYILYGTDVPLE